jgi:SAM-dependent methyltransferase
MDLYSDGRHYDALLGDQVADIAFYLSLARQAQGGVLELACGTGRITLPLALEGIDITGLDLSGPMLQRAREKAATSGARLSWVQADARSFDLAKQFSLIFLPYNSMQHLHDLPSLRSMLRCVLAHLAPDGLFALDVHLPNLALLSRSPREIYGVEDLGEAPDGRRVTGEEVSYSDSRQVYTIRWHYSANGAEEPRVDELKLRMFFPQELDALMQANGFEIVEKYGDFVKTPFQDQSLKQVLVCRRAGP